jgi:hypothetical protein
MDCSWFQCLKLDILKIIPLTRDEMHFAIGAVVFAIVYLARRPASFPIQPIIAVLLVAISVEAIDLWDDVARRGAPRWGASLHDIGVTIILPLILTALHLAMRRFADRKDRL